MGLVTQDKNVAVKMRGGWDPLLPDQISLRGGIHCFQTKFLFGVGSKGFCKKIIFSPIDPFIFLCIFKNSPMRRIPLFLLDLFYLQCQCQRRRSLNKVCSCLTFNQPFFLQYYTVPWLGTKKSKMSSQKGEKMLGSLCNAKKNPYSPSKRGTNIVFL